MTQPRSDRRRLYPDYDDLSRLGDEVISAIAAAEHDERQRAFMIVESRELVERICEALVKVEDADPRWPGWSAIDPPRGTLADHLRAQRQERARGR